MSPDSNPSKRISSPRSESVPQSTQSSILSVSGKSRSISGRLKYREWQFYWRCLLFLGGLIYRKVSGGTTEGNRVFCLSHTVGLRKRVHRLWVYLSFGWLDQSKQNGWQGQKKIIGPTDWCLIKYQTVSHRSTNHSHVLDKNRFCGVCISSGSSWNENLYPRSTCFHIPLYLYGHGKDWRSSIRQQVTEK